ncbi:hypothetical protein [Agrobacterium rosae]|uniref:Uncharacterized protein n=1 Tax=Agrobacterium rosae TaxID=1972867 RepID=A0A1R3U6E0_9HYPH|nr:hypothetical protein [Agrobacterium rosae]SCX34554.1 hypothetical protein DSM25559_4511 [Agrobacterium rosae]
MNYLPNWNKPGSFSAGRDPLGLQAVSVRLYTDLLPGLTNVTNRLRYFSFYCWVVRQFELRHHTTLEHKWSIFIRRAEAAYVLACQYGDGGEAHGMAGSVWAGKHTDLGRSFDFRPWTDGPGEDGQYLKARWGNFGQFYIASMQQMRMLGETTSRIQVVTKDYGLELANAFEEACPLACSRLVAAIDSGIIGHAACQEISDEAHPGYLNEASRESQVLVAYLCGDRMDDPTASARRATLWNVLNIVDRTGVVDDGELRRELYVQDRVGDLEASALVDNLKSWRAYFVNELCHIALELILNALTYRINAGILRSPDELVRGIASTALGAAAGSITVTELAFNKALDGLEDEHAAGMEIAGIVGTTQDPGEAILATATTLILSLWMRWGSDRSFQAILAPATVGGRSALGIFRFLDSQVDRSALDAIALLIRKFVVGNHLLIAGQKLASAGTYTYRFIVDDATLVDGLAAEYGFTNPRIGNLLTFAKDGGLIDDGKVTLAGKAFLRAAQPV